MSRFDSHEEIEIVEDYLNGLTMQHIADNYGCNRKTISRILHKNKVTIKHSAVNRTLKTDFFSKIEREEQAYMLGFIVADGNIYIREGEWRLSITQTAKDRDILDRFKALLSLDVEPYFRTEGNTYNMEIYSKEIVEDLLKYGIVPNKTYETKKLVPQNLPEKLIIPFIRGFIDGDGGFSKRPSSRVGYTFSATAHNKELLIELRSIINDLIDSDANNKFNNVENSWRVDWNRIADVYNIAKIFYCNSTIHLNRKYDIAQEILKVEDIV